MSVWIIAELLNGHLAIAKAWRSREEAEAVMLKDYPAFYEVEELELIE